VGGGFKIIKGLQCDILIPRAQRSLW